MLVNRIVVGRPYKRYRNAPDLVKPPEGFDSVSSSAFKLYLLTSLQVIGEIGWDLNHEGEFKFLSRFWMFFLLFLFDPETACYTNDAVRPAYLIVYGEKPKDLPKPSFKTLMSTLFKTPLVS